MFLLQGFLQDVNDMLRSSGQDPIHWVPYNNTTELNDAYHSDTRNFPIAVVFDTDPSNFNEPLR